MADPTDTPDRPDVPSMATREDLAWRLDNAKGAITLAVRHLVAGHPDAAEDVLRRYLRDVESATLERILDAEEVPRD